MNMMKQQEKTVWKDKAGTVRQIRTSDWEPRLLSTVSPPQSGLTEWLIHDSWISLITSTASGPSATIAEPKMFMFI